MAAAPARKCGNRKARSRELRRIEHDRKIYRLLRGAKVASINRHTMLGEAIEPLSVYFGKEEKDPKLRKLSVFPKTKQPNGKPMPHWDDLSKWLKVQQAVWVFDAWKFLTFNVHLHPDLESKWVAEGRDIRKLIMAELRRELTRLVRPNPEFFFVVEGWSVRDRASTMVHIHGGVAVLDPAEEPMIKLAVERACGHGVSDRQRPPRAVHFKPFTIERAAYMNYLFKAERKADPRLGNQRLAMSQSAVRAARDFWHMLTGRMPWDQP